MTVLVLPLRTTPDRPSDPSPAVSEDRKRQLLSVVVAAFDEVIPEFGDLDGWKWACIGIRRNMEESISDTVVMDARILEGI
jgi:hypothetical protein